MAGEITVKKDLKKLGILQDVILLTKWGSEYREELINQFTQNKILILESKDRKLPHKVLHGMLYTLVATPDQISYQSSFFLDATDLKF
jgi:hypothetical protein